MTAQSLRPRRLILSLFAAGLLPLALAACADSFPVAPALDESIPGLQASLVADDWNPSAPLGDGEVRIGRNGYVEIRAGTMPLIITAPHGGSLTPNEIPNRTWGSTTQDFRTKELALDIADAVEARMGVRPYVVFTQLHRSKLDANRDIVEGAQGSEAAEIAWQEFHGFVDAARADIEGKYGRGLLLDIHGHSHAIQRIELGYNVSAAKLGWTDAALDSANWETKSTIREIAEWHGDAFSEVLRGVDSFGGLLQAAGYAATPSPAVPGPGADPYFVGGYIVDRHGSQMGGTISAIQLEHQKPGIRDTVANRQAYAAAVAEVVEAYMARYYPQS